MLYGGSANMRSMLRSGTSAKAATQCAWMIVVTPSVMRFIPLELLIWTDFSGLLANLQMCLRVAVEAVAGHGQHDLFDLGGDDVAADELGVVENLADQPLGQDVLDEHF